MPAPQETVLPNGISLYTDKHDHLVSVPPARHSWQVWLGLLVLPGVLIWAWIDWEPADDPVERILAFVFFGFVAWKIVSLVDTLTRRTTIAATPPRVELVSAGLLGERRHSCERHEFRVGRHRQPRYDIPFLELYFGPRRVKALRGWMEWQVFDAESAMRAWNDDASLAVTMGGDQPAATGAVHTFMDGTERAIEIDPPVASAHHWMTMVCVVSVGVFLWIALADNGAPRALLVPIEIMVLGVAAATVGQMMTRTRIAVTPKYVAATSRGPFRKRSYTCERTALIVHGEDRKPFRTSLTLSFGTDTVRLHDGLSRRDAEQVRRLLVDWLSS